MQEKTSASPRVSRSSFSIGVRRTDSVSSSLPPQTKSIADIPSNDYDAILKSADETLAKIDKNIKDGLNVLSHLDFEEESYRVKQQVRIKTREIESLIQARIDEREWKPEFIPSKEKSLSQTLSETMDTLFGKRFSDPSEEEEEEEGKLVELNEKSFEAFQKKLQGGSKLTRSATTRGSSIGGLLDTKLKHSIALIQTISSQNEDAELLSTLIDSDIHDPFQQTLQKARSMSSMYIGTQRSTGKQFYPPFYSAELSAHIFQFLEMEDIISVSEVCRAYAFVARDKAVWEKILGIFGQRSRGSASEPEDINIWNETNQKSVYQDAPQRPNKGSFNILEPNKAATGVLVLNKIIAKLTPEQPKNNSVSDSMVEGVLSTYRQFTTNYAFLRKLFQRYHVPDSLQQKYNAGQLNPKEGTAADDFQDYVGAVVTPIHLRVCRVLKCLIENYFNQLSQDDAKLVLSFLRCHVYVDHPIVAKSLLRSLCNKITLRNIEEQLSKHSFSALTEPLLLHIFGYLPLRDLFTVEQACKTCRNVINKSKALWRSLFMYYDNMIAASDTTGEDDVNIWSVEDQPQETSEKTPDAMRCASLNQLVQLLTPSDKTPDVTDIKAFLTTYTTFTTPRKLIRKLIQRYQVPVEPESVDNPNVRSSTMSQYHLTWSSEKLRHEFQKPIQLRVCKVLKILIEDHFSDFDPVLLNLVYTFIRGAIDETTFSTTLMKALRHALDGSKKFEDEMLSPRGSAFLSGSSGFLPTILKSSKSRLTIAESELFSVVPAEELARQLTLIDFEIFSEIKPSEFFRQAWSKPELQHLAPNIRRMIDRFNSLTKWIVYEIVSPVKVKQRVKAIQKFIDMAKVLKNIHNYHTLMAIISGLMEGAVYRLKFTKERVSPKYNKIYKDLEALMSADGSYKAYRAELRQIEPPCLPYLGVYLRDLVYFFEESGRQEQGNHNLINFKQRKNIYAVIYAVQVCQHASYNFPINQGVYSALKNLPQYDDKDLMALSLQREPRNVTRSNIQ